MQLLFGECAHSRDYWRLAPGTEYVVCVLCLGDELRAQDVLLESILEKRGFLDA